MTVFIRNKINEAVHILTTYLEMTKNADTACFAITQQLPNDFGI